MRFKWRR